MTKSTPKGLIGAAIVLSISLGSLALIKHYRYEESPVGDHNKPTAVNPGAMVFERDHKKVKGAK